MRDKSSSSVPRPCFECGGRGQHATKCANNRMASQKRDKAMMATCSDSEDGDSIYSD